MVNKSRRRPARRGGHGGGFTAKIISLLLLLVLLGVGFAFLRANHITSMAEAVTYIRTAGRNTADSASKADTSKLKNCNVVSDPNCLYGDKKASVPQTPANNGNSTPSAPSKPNANVEKPKAKVNPKPADTPKPVVSSSAKDQLAKLKVADATKDKLNLSDYRRWVLVGGRCDTRDMILKQVGFKTDPKTCKPLAGHAYTDFYGKTVTDPDKLIIDYAIPLQYVNQHGGSAWNADKRQEYANDINFMVPVTKTTSILRKNSGPSKWMPRNRDRQCSYARNWVSAATKYGVSITDKDKTALSKALDTCSE